MTLVLLCALGVAFWVNREPFLDILTIGLRDEEQSHLFLVPFIAAWLFWLRRSRLRYVRVRPSFIGPACVVVGMIMSWWGFNTYTDIAWHAGAGLTVLGALFSFTGLEPVRQFLPVFGVLVFALPVPGVIRLPIAQSLQTLATQVTQATLELVGVPATRLGNVLDINGQQIAVGEACNGMRMVFAFGLVVYAFVFSTPLKLNTRLILLALSPVVALVCNVIRLVPTSLIYGYGPADRAEWFHDVTGWVMLPVALIALVAALRLFTWLELPVSQFRLAGQ
jgi:exosortase